MLGCCSGCAWCVKQSVTAGHLGYLCAASLLVVAFPVLTANSHPRRMRGAHLAHTRLPAVVHVCARVTYQAHRPCCLCDHVWSILPCLNTHQDTGTCSTLSLSAGVQEHWTVCTVKTGPICSNYYKHHIDRQPAGLHVGICMNKIAAAASRNRCIHATHSFS